MIVLLFVTFKLIQSCKSLFNQLGEYHCETCDTNQDFCSSCPSTRNLKIVVEKGANVNVCHCKQNFVDIGGQECLQCPSNCVDCDPNDPSKCISCGNEELTYRVLGSNQTCICKEGYIEVWYTYNCQNIQFKQQILQFQYILSLEQYVNGLQNKYSYSQITIQGLDYMIERGIVNDGINQFQLISKLESNKIISTTTPYPQGQAYMQKFDNLFAFGIMLNHESTMIWAANVNYINYNQYSGIRILNQSIWEFVIFQFLLQKYEGNVFLQIALLENNNIKNEKQNRLLEIKEGKMALCYYLAYELNNFLLESQLDEIINDILYILLQRPSNSLDYFYNGQELIIQKCQPNYILKNKECQCDNENGYYIYNNICQLQCPDDCITCTKEVCLLADHSIRCQENYYLDIQKNICLQCYQTCQTCNNEKECTKLIAYNCLCLKCMDGYQLDEFYQCIECSQNCKSCHLQDQCNICKDGYYLSDNQCFQCNENCILCQDLNYCIKSQKGYYIENGIALKCINNCLDFLNECQCQDCFDKQYRNDIDLFCYPCPVDCQTCVNQQTCINCVSNSFYLDNSECKECQFPCLTCLSQTKCLSCIDEQHYYIKEHQNCAQCPTPCKTCYYNENPLCTSCLQNHYLLNQQCYECPLYCKDACIFDTIKNFIQCEQCQKGFYPTYINIPFECKRCKEYCTICINEESCLECSLGYILNNGKCQSCSQLYQNQCISCNNQFCLQCQNGYKLNNGNCIEDKIIEVPICLVNKQYYNTISNSCDSCIQNCIICKEQQTCIKCEETYYEKSEICIQCKFPCNTCLNDQFCLTISNQLYYIDNRITELNQINSFRCKSPCNKCYSNEECIDCIDGFYFENNNKCLQCDSMCKTCKNMSTFCTSCNLGFLLLNGVCYQCLDQNCQNCNQFCQSCNHFKDDLYKCQSCLIGYYLINQECHQCNSICQSCSQSSNQCSSCFEGYFLTSEMKCEKCNLGCKSCQVQTKSCILCEDGYYLSEIKERKCQQCVLPCLKCTTLTQCTLCENGYYLNNEMCERCMENCLTCSSSNNCLICQDSYQLVDLKCIKCPNNCITCNEGQCLQCEQEYILQNDGYCHKVSVICNINQCQKCLDVNLCLSCSKGYTLNTKNDECKIENQILDSESTDKDDSGTIFIIISAIFSLISFTLIYLIIKCRKIQIKIKLIERTQPKFPELPVTISEFPADEQN
ncbi:unnamed protein product [Paramecium primaurelia]|uniref:TNFR-Cys domain-containing protein n=1 Tax=Paramecium primaurelia TaxID=5886 RepID=A0A8S1P3T6_PARPR|nr:unnamed protein product [Paramecium primaurelia]